MSDADLPLAFDDTWDAGMRNAIEVVKRRRAYYELYRDGDNMRTKPATFAIIEELLVFLEADLQRSRDRAKPLELVLVVTYWCRGCGSRLTMPSAKPGAMVFVGRAWCWRCDKYVTQAEATATSKQEPKP